MVPTYKADAVHIEAIRHAARRCRARRSNGAMTAAGRGAMRPAIYAAPPQARLLRAAHGAAAMALARTAKAAASLLPIRTPVHLPALSARPPVGARLLASQRGQKKDLTHGEVRIRGDARAAAEATRSRLKYAHRMAALAKPFEETLVCHPAVKEAAASKALSADAQHGQRDLTRLLGYGLTRSDVDAVTEATAACAGDTRQALQDVQRILSLEYSSAAQITKYNIARAVEEFARSPNDTGSPEIQIAIWTIRIRAMEAHVALRRHDYVTERKIVEFRDQRRKMCKYLQRESLDRYYACLDKLRLPHDIVEAASTRFPAKSSVVLQNRAAALESPFKLGSRERKQQTKDNRPAPRRKNVAQDHAGGSYTAPSVLRDAAPRNRAKFNTFTT